MSETTTGDKLMFDWLRAPKEQIQAWDQMRSCASELPIPPPTEQETEISIDPLLAICLARGYHQFAQAPDGTRGMSKKAYAALWPRTIRINAMEIRNHSSALLVDRTISPEGLSRLVPLELRSVKPGTCRDRVAPPCDSEEKPLRRYIALITYGPSPTHRELTTTADEYCEQLPPEVTPLVAIEAVHVAVQYGDKLCRWHLRNVGPYSMRVPGTTVGTDEVICLRRDHHRKLLLGTSGRRICNNEPGREINDFCGNASRLTQVIPVP